jgi:ribosomal protein S6--L-glutamate ligase
MKIFRVVKLVRKKHRKINVGQKLLVGWKEWCALPDIDIPAIKAKLDTGAKTSSLHAYDIESYHRHGELWVKFKLHPIQRNSKIHISRSAKVVDQRHVMSSTGHKELRFVIMTSIILGDKSGEIELTLANREKMIFKMLLGRDAIKDFAVIDPIKAYYLGKISSRRVKMLYKDEQQ